MADFSIRRATTGDCEAIADLSSALNRQQGMTEWHRPDVAALRANFDHVDIYLAEMGGAPADGRPVGFIAGFRHFNPHNGFCRYVVTSLFVDEAARRQGIGAALLRTLVLDDRQADIRQFAIDVMPTSREACALYAALGFEKRAPGFENYRLGWERLAAFRERAEP